MNQGEGNRGVVNADFGAGVLRAGVSVPARDWCEGQMLGWIRGLRYTLDNCFTFYATETVDTYRAHHLQGARDSVERLRFLLWMCVRCGFTEGRAACESALTLSSDQQRLIDAKE